jgi:lysozyme family protein
MPTTKKSPATYQSQYATMFDRAKIKPGLVDDVDAICNRILKHKADYEAIAKKVAVPWYLISVFHYRESNLDFSAHLHNGDPLTARTVHVPAGRPTTGAPPFTFVASAIDALEHDGFVDIGDEPVGKLLYLIENFNGAGYRNRGVPSPYLWSFTDQYEAGKYVADGRYDADAVDKQCGIAPILLRLYERKEIELRGFSVPVTFKGKESSIAAFLLRGNSFIGARTLSTANHCTLTTVTESPFVLRMGTDGGRRTQDFPAMNLSGVGYIDASDACAFLSLSIALNAGVLNVG